MRKITAITLGLLVSMIVIFLLEKLGHLLFATPLKIDQYDLETIKAFVAEAPTGVFIFVIIAFAIGALAGGFTTALTLNHHKTKAAINLGGILIGIGISNFTIIPHPIWVVILSLLVFVPFAYFGAVISTKIRPEKEMQHP
jgi:hypothetical protein